MMRLIKTMAWMAFALLILAGCQSSTGGGGDDNGGGGTEPTYSEEEFDGAVDEFGGDLTEVATKVEADAGVSAVTQMPTFPLGRGGIFGGESLTLRVQPFADEDLPRGEYEYDSSTGEWVLVADSSTSLVLRWEAVDFETGASYPAELVVDWSAGGPTEDVSDGQGGTVEVPTGMNVTLSVDGTPAADFDADFAWYSDATCPGGVAEPTLVNVDGEAGVDATISLTDVGFQISADTISSSGDVSVSADGDSAGFDWDVSTTGTITRDACFIEDFEVASGSVDFSLYSDPAGEARSSVGFGFAFDNIVLEAGSDTLQSVDLSGGQVTIDGATAVTFSGTFDDADSDGIWGDNVTVTFTGEASKSLEAIIEEQMATASGFARLLSLVR